MVGYERLRWIRDSVLDFTDLDALVVVEGPSFGSRGNAVHQLGGLWWLITEALDRRGCLLAVASPQTRAKYATGRGNAGKDEVLAAAVRRFTAFMVVSNDEADALILCAMGCDRLGMPIAPMPAEHRKALNAVDWPEGVTT
jgi:Holliday junction resolvasome RuvABC endonuclease subunit